MYIGLTKGSNGYPPTVQIGRNKNKVWCPLMGFKSSVQVYSVPVEEFSKLSGACAYLVESWMKPGTVKKIEFGNGGLEEMAFEAIMLHGRGSKA